METASGLRYSGGVVAHLVADEFRLRYRRTALGWIWAVSQPLARLLVLTFVFTRVLPLDIPNYPVFLFTGLIAWNWFAAGVASATRSPVDRSHLLFRPGVPRAAIPLVSVLTDGLDYAAALPILAIFVVMAGDGIPLTMLALPLILLVEFTLIVGLGFALSAVNVKVRDAYLFVNVAMLLGFYVTPIFYDPASIPGGFRWVLAVNPVAQLIAAQRDVVVHARLPDALPFLALTAACVLILAGGYALYRRASPTFLDEI